MDNKEKSLDELIKYRPNSRLPYSFRIYSGCDPLTGTVKHIQRSYSTRNGALKALVKIKKAIDSGCYQSQEKHYKFSKLVEMWLPRYKTTVKRSTYASVKQVIDNHILPDVGRFYIDKLTVVQCQNIVDRWHEQLPKSLKKFFTYSRRILDYAVHLELITSNPMRKVILPRNMNVKTEVKKYYSISELQDFLNACKAYGKPMYYTYFMLQAHTGMRPSEGLGVCWSDIDFDNRLLHLRRTVTSASHNEVYIDTPKTKDSIRDIALDADAIKVLREWRLECLKNQKVISLMGGQDYVFYNPNNDIHVYTRQQVDAWDRKIAKKYGVRFISPHGFRHTFATILYESGSNPKDIQEALGHSTVKTTMDMYTHLSDQHKHVVANNFEKALNSKAVNDQ